MSESIASRLVELGNEADIDVSWRGPEELAAGLYRNPVLLDQFPGLQATKVAKQLADIQDTLTTLSAATAGTPRAGTLDRSPRTPDEQHQLVTAKQPAWEYLLFAGVLAQGLARMEPKWRDLELRISRHPFLHLDLSETTQYLQGAFHELSVIWEPVNRLFDPAAQEQAFGAPGEPGDPVVIEHFAQRIVDMYEQTLDWGIAMRSLDVPEPLRRSIQLASDAAHRPAKDAREFIEHVVKETDRMPGLLASPDPAPVTMHMSLILNADDQVMAAFDAELKRATAQIVSE